MECSMLLTTTINYFTQVYFHPRMFYYKIYNSSYNKVLGSYYTIRCLLVVDGIRERDFV